MTILGACLTFYKINSKSFKRGYVDRQQTAWLNVLCENPSKHAFQVLVKRSQVIKIYTQTGYILRYFIDKSLISK